MKIISKYKDYYDFLVGKYGEDPLIVLDRRTNEFPPRYVFDYKVTFFICDLEIEGLVKNGKVYYGKDIEPFAHKEKDYKGLKRYRNRHTTEKDRHTTEKEKVYYAVDIGGRHLTTFNIKPVKSNVNTKVGVPILMLKSYISKPLKQLDNFYCFPILKDWNIQSLIKPEDMFLMLSAFVAKKDVDNDNRTDKEKIVDAGFDLKSSFRNC